MDDNYVVGGISSVISGRSKTPKQDQALAALFSPKGAAVKQKLVQKILVPVQKDNKSGDDKKDAVKPKKRKSTLPSEEDDSPPTKKMQGYSPPAGIVHESLVKKKKKKGKSSKITSDSDSPVSSAKQKRQAEDDKMEQQTSGLKRKKFRRSREKERRSIFVGNLPTSIKKKEILKLFKGFGAVESVRIRSATGADPKLPKKVAVIKKDFHPKRTTVNAYVVFESQEQAKEALAVNGKEVDGFHIRVDLSAKAKENDHKRSIFVGNLPFDIEEESVRKHFEDVGDIENVRIIRDAKTGVGKGFGYVLFKDESSVSLALRLNNHMLKDRALRILRSVKKEKKRLGVAPNKNDNRVSRTGSVQKGVGKKKDRFTKTGPTDKNKKKGQSQTDDFDFAKEFGIKIKGKQEKLPSKKKKIKRHSQDMKKKNMAGFLLGDRAQSKKIFKSRNKGFRNMNNSQKRIIKKQKKTAGKMTSKVVSETKGGGKHIKFDWTTN